MDIIIIDGLSFALPLFIMAIGGIYCEKSGVTMLAVEGLQGFGAFTGALMSGRSVYEAARIAADYTVHCIRNTQGDPDHWYGVKFETAIPELISALQKNI